MRRNLFLILLFASGNLWISSDADARYYRRGGGYGGFGGAQTPQSAQANAMANVIRSQGMYNVATSQAMVNMQRARSISIANQQSAMQFYYARKRAVEAEHANELEQEKAKIQRYQQYMAQEQANIPKLNSSQLNATTGQLTWPRGLQDGGFAEHRKAAEEYFSLRASHSSTIADSKKMHETIAAMHDELRGHIHDMNTIDYLESRKFLDTLSSEVEHTRS